MKKITHLIGLLFLGRKVPEHWINKMYWDINQCMHAWILMGYKHQIEMELWRCDIRSEDRARLHRMLRFCEYRIKLLEMYEAVKRAKMGTFLRSITNNLQEHYNLVETIKNNLN